MKDFKTSLLREKFIIKPDDKKESPIIALSNRIVIHLISEDGIDDETFIIRTQNMHSCTRFAAALIKEFYERGTIANRIRPMPWENIWSDVIKGYERDWNTEIWGAVYHKGRILFKDGEYHPFLDIIEKCDVANKKEYAESIKYAEEAFSQAGKKVHIEHDSNIALVVSTNKEQAKCGIIVRSASGTTTFNYVATPNPDNPRPIQPYTTLTVAAAFLESIQLAFQVGMMNKKQDYNLIEKFSDEDRKHKRAETRLGNLDRAITNYEQSFHVTYRPQRPVVSEIVERAATHSIKILKPQIEAKLSGGELDESEWVI
ncbi:MAG: hypothetical protein R3D88_02710 [Alphaproteobacteria bacterium]|nr:hypothetical protein [Alphaproteobacteria bacterium]